VAERMRCHLAREASLLDGGREGDLHRLYRLTIVLDEVTRS
jgi:hypothetical protein